MKKQFFVEYNTLLFSFNNYPGVSILYCHVSVLLNDKNFYKSAMWEFLSGCPGFIVCNQMNGTKEKQIFFILGKNKSSLKKFLTFPFSYRK